MISHINFTSQKDSYVLPVNELGHTSIHNAALHDDPVTIQIVGKFLSNEINRPSEFNVIKKQVFKDTPAHLAAYHGKWEALAALVALGADLHARNALNERPIDNVLCDQQKLYDQAVHKGRKIQTTAQHTISQATQTISSSLCEPCKTKPHTTESIPTQTDPEEPYQEVTIRYYGSTPPANVITQLTPLSPHEQSVNSTQFSLSTSTPTHQALPPYAARHSYLNVQAIPFKPVLPKKRRTSLDDIWETSPNALYPATNFTSDEKSLDEIVEAILK